MGDLLEDLPPEHMNFLNSMDSGNASGEDNSDDSDYEARLYSLVHYSQEDAFEVGDDSDSDIFTHVSKGTKVSRLNPVKDIDAGNSSPFGDAHNKFLSSNNDLRSLLHAYRNAQSEFSHSTPVRNNHCRNTSLANSSRQKSVPSEVNEDSYIEIGNQSVSDCINVSSFNESVISDRIPDRSSLINIGDTGSKSKRLNCVNKLGHSGGTSGKNLTRNVDFERNYIENNCSPSKSSLSLSEKKKNESIVEIEDFASSKYNMDLNKGKTNTPTSKKHRDSKKKDINESVIVLDDSDSESNSSILEMEVPVKEPPPVVVLSSEDEKDNQAVESEKEEEDIVVLYSGGEKSSTMRSNENGETSGVKSKKKDKKKKKNKKKNKLANFTNQDVGATSWTESMSRFYNDSWGGENFDAAKLQLSMSGKRSKWPLVVADLDAVNRVNGQRSIKCQKCNHYGHRARCCTEPQKPIVCLYCGLEGHVQTKCPTAICLRCGKPSMVYNFGCNTCSSDRSYNIPCSLCNLTGHHASDCPETWRRYHAAITEEDLSNEMRTMYKPSNQQHCSNCAGKGHQYHECNESRKQGNWQKRANSSFREHNMYAKRRKLDEKYPQRGLYHKQKYNKRHNNYPLLSYFDPFYKNYMR